MDGLMFSLAAVAGALLLIGTARIAAWVIDRREEAAHRPIRDAAFVAESAAEVGK